MLIGYAKPILCEVTMIKEEDKIWMAFAIQDINKGQETLWVNQFKKSNPELYEYAIKRRDANWINENEYKSLKQSIKDYLIYEEDWII